MTNDDQKYISSISSASFFRGPVLELGGGYGGDTCREIVESKGLIYQATDMMMGPGVDFVANFENGEGVQALRDAGPFGTVLVLNVLEHTFDPIGILDNVLKVISDDGAIVFLTPAIWPIHNYPVDCCRLLPDWYRRFAETRGLKLLDETFQYVECGRVSDFRSNDQDNFPIPAYKTPLYRNYSRAIHKVFNTFGRGMLHSSHLAIAGVFVRS